MMQVKPATLRDAPSVTEQPTMTMVQWRVLELTDGARVLAGMLAEQPTLRITTAIVTHEGRQVTTSSGRAYTLFGEPSSDPDVLGCIAQEIVLLGYVVRDDVTEEHWNASQSGGDAALPHTDGDR